MLFPKSSNKLEAVHSIRRWIRQDSGLKLARAGWNEKLDVRCMFPQPGWIFRGAHWAGRELNLTQGMALVGNAESKGFHQTLWSLRTSRQREILLNLFFAETGRKQSAVVPQAPGQAGAGGEQRDSAWALHRWSHQNAGVMSSRLAIPWAFTVLTYAARDSQTSDYRANKYEEGPELNSIPVQQSHLSLGIILCWIGRGSWNKT